IKPTTVDLRDAPSLDIARQLLKMGCEVKAYDPLSLAICKTQNPDLDMEYATDLTDLAHGVDALVLVTEWEEFRRANWQEIREVMRTPLIVDGRNALNEADIVAAGLNYRGIGR
ncbi:MAG: UDP binding domain-containing protein, partial [Candidatus Obscuribacterales bacterium]